MFPNDNARAAEPMSRMLELPEPIYEALVEVAKASGVAPADWIASRLPHGVIPIPPRSDRNQAPTLERLLRHAGAVDLGYPTGTDNEAIDAEIAREYGDTHEDVP
jgi:hypothetical protein